MGLTKVGLSNLAARMIIHHTHILIFIQEYLAPTDRTLKKYLSVDWDIYRQIWE